MSCNRAIKWLLQRKIIQRSLCACGVHRPAWYCHMERSTVLCYWCGTDMWSGITLRWDVSGELISTAPETDNPFRHIMTLAECAEAEKPNSELESPPWLVPVETVVAAIEDYDPRSVKMSLADYVVVRCHSNQPNPVVRGSAEPRTLDGLVGGKDRA